MKKIAVAVLNKYAIYEAEKMAVCCARLTQRGEKIKSMEDFIELYERPYTEQTLTAMVNLPHPTLQKFSVINVVVVGASRRFLAQITRHQNEVKFMSASMQYSNYQDDADFVIPFDIKNPDDYIKALSAASTKYKELIDQGVSNDSCGYIMPHALRNVLVISATPYQWKHMISQRICNRNTPETKYVMLKIWEALYELSPQLFSIKTTGAFCQRGGCPEGRFSCGKVYSPDAKPTDLIKAMLVEYENE